MNWTKVCRKGNFRWTISLSNGLLRVGQSKGGRRAQPGRWRHQPPAIWYSLSIHIFEHLSLSIHIFEHLSLSIHIVMLWLQIQNWSIKKSPTKEETSPTTWESQADIWYSLSIHIFEHLTLCICIQKHLGVVTTNSKFEQWEEANQEGHVTNDLRFIGACQYIISMNHIVLHCFAILAMFCMSNAPLNLPSALQVVLRRWKLLPSQSHRGSRLQKPKPLPAEQSPLGGFDFSFCSSKVSNNNNVFKRTGQWRLPSDISSSPIYSKNSNKKECEVRSLHKYLANWILWTLSYIWETINTHLEVHCQIAFLDALASLEWDMPLTG